VDELCNRVAIIRRGQIAYEGSLAQLRRAAGLGYRLRTTDDQRARAILAERRDVTELGAESGGALTFKVVEEAAVAELSRALAQCGAGVLELSPRQATLEDLFFQLTEDGSGRAGDPTAAETGKVTA
jgi:ABC-type multidrug transport system ATPase subunit